MIKVSSIFEKVLSIICRLEFMDALMIAYDVFILVISESSRVIVNAFETIAPNLNKLEAFKSISDIFRLLRVT